MDEYQPSKTTVYQFFKNEQIFEIPRFQRSFSWKEQNIDDFYDDFIKTSQSYVDFLGTIVIDASQKHIFQIIDGQQRIIAITIVAAAMRDILREEISTEEAQSLATIIDTHFIKKDPLSKGGYSYRLKPSIDLEDFLDLFVQRGDASSRSEALKLIKPGDKNDEPKRLVKKAYDSLRKKLTEDKIKSLKSYNPDDAVQIFSDVIRKFNEVSFIEIKIFNNDMAYAIFENHNAKGMDLAVSDLVKNYYFGQLGGSDQNKEKFMQRWDDAVAQIQEAGDITVDRFLHYYVQSLEGKSPKSQLYIKLKKLIQNDPQKFIKELELNINIFIQLKTGSTDGNLSNKINHSLSAIKIFNVDQCYILLLSLFRNQHKFNPSSVFQFVKAIENFTFVYSKIAQQQANEIEKLYSRLAKEIETTEVEKKNIDAYSGQKYSSLSRELKSLMPPLDSFQLNFIDLDYSKSAQKRLINYVFSKFEEHYSNGGTLLGPEIHLDHIFPQNPNNSVIKPKYLHKIGNLVALDNLSGSKSGNKLPAEKIAYYEASRSALLKELLDDLKASSFQVDDDFIISRGKQLALRAHSEVWQIK